MVGIHCLLGSLFQRDSLSDRDVDVDDATTICTMEKPKDLQRWSVVFQYPF